MSHLRVLICRVDEDEDNAMCEVACVDVPPAVSGPEALLEGLEAAVAPIGADIMCRLIELAWEEVDVQAVARYRAGQAPGDVWADGYETLTVASRFGQLHLRRQVCAHRDGRPHALPGNAFLPPHHGMLLTRGLQEWACLLPQELPFAAVARLLGWQAHEADILVRAAVRTCADQSLLVLMDGARWIRAFFRDHLADLPRAEMVLDWHLYWLVSPSAHDLTDAVNVCT